LAEEYLKNNFFDTEHLKSDLKGRSVRGGAITLGAQWARFCIQMASTVVLARLLTPQDFGLIAMVTAVTGFVAMFKDMGLSMATVQRAEINHGQISTLFWINVALSLGIMLVTAALAPVIARLYGEPRLTRITLALAGGIIFGGLTVQHQALLRRQMRFGALAVIDIVSMSAGMLAGIIAALYGLRYWALVIMHIAQPITLVVTVWITCTWRPGLPIRRSGVRKMLAFGGYLTGFSFVNYFARNMDYILIGKFCEVGILGLYTKAYHLLMLPIAQIRNPLNMVAIPALSRLANTTERFRSYFEKLVSFVAILSMPLVVFLAVCAKELILLILGKQWIQAVPLFQILAITAFIQPTGQLWGAAVLSLGNSRKYFILGTINAIVVVVGFSVGISWGSIGVATSYAIATYTALLPTLHYAFARTPLSIGSFFKAIYGPVVASIFMGLIIYLLRSWLSEERDIFILCLCAFVGISSYFCMLFLVLKGRIQLREVRSLLPMLFKRPAHSI